MLKMMVYISVLMFKAGKWQPRSHAPGNSCRRAADDGRARIATEQH
jgi:hypothetical protein